VIQPQAEFTGSLVVPAVVPVELRLHGRLVGLGVFQALVDGVHGGLDAFQAFFDEIEALIHGVETFVHRSEPAVNRVKTPVEILVQLGPLGFVIHMFLQYASGRRNGQATKPAHTKKRDESLS